MAVRSLLTLTHREALDAWLQEEPFLKAGVYRQIDVKPFNKAFPQG